MGKMERESVEGRERWAKSKCEMEREMSEKVRKKEKDGEIV
jgi:hypothetical protein